MFLPFTKKRNHSKKSSPQLCGGKGHNLVVLKKKGFSVPDGLVITTDSCNQYRALSSAGEKDAFLDSIMVAIRPTLGIIQASAKTSLVSIRSGAEISMPGMMDTILNVGAGYPDSRMPHTNSFTLDCEKRFLSMFLSSAYDAEELLLDSISNLEDDLTCKKAFTILSEYYPDVTSIIKECIASVFNSWDSSRATIYRKNKGIPHTLGTAVVIQSMVFGNYNDRSLSGVLFSRNPNTGSPHITGEYLINAQGEDVVNGKTTPLKLECLEDKNLLRELENTARNIDLLYGDMQDIEFTVEDGSLFILQTRSAKRSVLAEVVCALDDLSKGMLDNISDRVEAGTLSKLRNSSIPTNLKYDSMFTGLASGGGVSTGKVCHSIKDVLDCKEPAVLLSEYTTPEDIEGMINSVAVVTTKGGITCHAAIVSRGMGLPCVVGCRIDSIIKDNYLLVDGDAGRVYTSSIPFDINITRELNYPVVDSLLEFCNLDTYTVRLSSVEEALSLQSHFLKIALPDYSFSGYDKYSVLKELSNTFDVIIIEDNSNEEVTSFIGERENTPQKLDLEIFKLRLEHINNIYLNKSNDPKQYAVLPKFSTIQQLTDDSFYGVITNDYIYNIVGSKDRLATIIEDYNIKPRIIEYKDLFEVIELQLGIV